MLRDDEGLVLWCFVERCVALEVDVGEALAVRKGLKLARDNGVLDLDVESDAQMIIKVILHPKHDLSYLGGVVCGIVEIELLSYEESKESCGSQVGSFYFFLTFYFISVHVLDPIVASVVRLSIELGFSLNFFLLRHIYYVTHLI